MPPDVGRRSRRPIREVHAPIALMHRNPREETIRLLRDVSGRERHDTGGHGGSTDPVTGNNPVTGGTVVDQPTLMSQNALIFTVTTIGTGSGIRADADTSDCATPPPGTTLGIGG